METEDVSPRFENLDAWPSAEAVQAMFEGQLAAVAAVGPALSAIVAAGDLAAERLKEGGRLVYAGAGTSGRLGFQDGTELTPTFDWPEERLVLAMAGGERALRQSTEGAEDDVENARQLVDEHDVGRDDVVIGTAASGTTPFTVGFLEAARRRGALTIGIANNPGTPVLKAAEHPILVATGPEVLAGSTRMKAGTAQKVVLNLLSTLIMIRLGRVYRGLMIDMRARNAKLTRRSETMVSRLAECDAQAARAALEAANGDLKLAVLFAKGIEPATAYLLLDRSGGQLRAALAELAAPEDEQAESGG